ncbi:hypothetical protein AKJ63_00405, partial [candidate division MSBL1 archaeon SCGC-AAA259D18]
LRVRQVCRDINDSEVFEIQEITDVRFPAYQPPRRNQVARLVNYERDEKHYEHVKKAFHIAVHLIPLKIGGAKLKTLTPADFLRVAGRPIEDKPESEQRISVHFEKGVLVTSLVLWSDLP